MIAITICNILRDLEFYIDCFSSLNTMKKCGKPAPHKALLLLSVIDLIERGVITNCQVLLSEELELQFKHNTSVLLDDSILFQPKISYPYFHMKSEPFWELISSTENPVGEMGNYSITNLRKHIAYARIDEELFNLLQNPNVCAKLRVTLISKYIYNQPTLADNLPLILFAFGTLAHLIA